jgi:hypothetical protein
MTSKTKFEAMLEALVNEDQSTAKALFHDIVVDKSRKIYERILAEEFTTDEEDDTDEFASDDDTTDMDFGADEEDDFDSEESDDFDTDFDAEDDMDADEGDIEDRVLDLEDALDELKAEFEALMSDEEGESEHDDMDFGSDEETTDMDFGADEEDDFGSAPADKFGASKGDEEFQKMMEYVNKVALPKHGDDGVQNKSVVANKNDMGGTTANILRGGEAKNGGTQGGLLKPTTSKLDGGNVNVPGAKSATKLKAVPKGHGAEKKGPGESATNKRSLVGSK